MILDWNMLVILVIIFAVGILSGTIWIFLKGVMFIGKILYYIALGLFWLVSLPFRKGE
jgi:hypothetical protein